MRGEVARQKTYFAGSAHREHARLLSHVILHCCDKDAGKVLLFPIVDVKRML
jgi:hypothetical protein